MPSKPRKKTVTVLVIGGGIAGLATAKRLGQAGVQTHVVERQAEIGGRIREIGCKATEVCLRCHGCLADEVLRSTRRAPGVQIHTRAELLELRPGARGRRFTAVLGNAAGAAKRAKPVVLDADAVVIATGFEPYNPRENASFAYGRVPNVMTGVEAERQLAVDHKLNRPSDGRPARRIAFIQCVGSRTEEVFRRPEDTDYCSAVCCAYALRIARRLQHQAPETEVTVFYMDIQNFGKGFNEFYQACRQKMRFIRSRPYEIREGSAGAVRVKYAPDSKAAGDKAVCEEEFDLVVLSVGMRPAEGTARLAETLGVPLDERGFVGLKGATAFPDLQRPGIYVVGACESPKDIAGCLDQADAVSAAVLSEASA